MSFANDKFVFCAAVCVLTWLLSGCGGGAAELDSCPPDDEPAEVGRSCSADGECDGYLVCDDTVCSLPPTVTGEPSEATANLGMPSAQVSVEVARSDLERRRGLGGRPCMQPGWGMLFVHPHEEILEYSVAQMRFPIDLAFLDAAGEVVRVYQRLEPGVADTYSSDDPARFALEVRAGQLEEWQLSAGDRVAISDRLQ